jgi:NADH dehydrogenase
MRTVFVSGGASFLAGAVIPSLLSAGLKVRALRRSRNAPDIPADPPGDMEWVEGDLLSEGAWQPAVAGCAAVVHLAAAGAGTGRELRAANVEATQALLDAAAAGGVERIVHLSSAAVTDGDPDPYGASKRDAEDLVHRSGIPFVIIRPTWIVGKGDRNFLPRLIGRARGRGPLLNVGRFLVQPVFVEDVAQAITAAVVAPSAVGQIYELAGVDAISYETFLGDLLRAANCPVPLVINVPARACVPVAIVLDRLRGGYEYRRRVRYGGRDHVYDISRARRDLGFDPEHWRHGIGRRSLATD